MSLSLYMSWLKCVPEHPAFLGEIRVYKRGYQYCQEQIPIPSSANPSTFSLFQAFHHHQFRMLLSFRAGILIVCIVSVSSLDANYMSVSPW